MFSTPMGPSGPTITSTSSRSYCLANSKSRWSWVGTAITAPVPYSMSTKLATNTGMRRPVRGWTQ